MIKPFKGKNPNLEKFFIPRSVQQSIPIKKVHKDGVFEVASLYSKTWRFFDVNYAVAGPEKKEALFLSYCAFLNSLPVRALVKITLFNRTMNQQEFSRNLLMQMAGDGRDRYRVEYNDILTENAANSNNLTQEKYITISVERKNIEEARAFFNRVGTELSTYLSRMDVMVRDTNVVERMRLFHDFFRPNDPDFQFDLNRIAHRGNDFRDAIAPDCMTFYKDHYEIGDQVGRVLFLRDYASFIKDEMITELCDLPRNMMISINLLPIPTDEVVKEIQRRIMAIESDVGRFTQRQNSLNNFNATIPYHLEQSRLQTRELMDDVTTRDQGLMLGQVTITHLADTLEQLDQDTETLVSIGQGRGCQISTLKYQQEDGLNTVLPYGLQRVEAMRSLTTESTAVLMPFKAQEIQDKGGVYYGVNAVSHNLIICNRANLLNGNGFILGVSGSGKSMAAKQELTSLMLGTDHDIIVVDPEREYGPLVRALGGEVITISASSDQCSYINALDLSAEYGDGKNPLVLKSEFIMSLCEQLMGNQEIGAKEKSIIDRCTANIYREYIKDFKGEPPTLKDLHRDLMMQKEPAAHDIALALELFTTGTLNVFSHQTNINSNNRLLCFDIQDLGENLKPVGLLVMLDAIFNRVIRNRQQGRYTHVYIDEIYLFFSSGSGRGQSSINQYSGEFLYKCWKRFRKYGAMLTGITQNVEECLRSETAKLMFANSEFLLMFNQAATDRMELAKLLGTSDKNTVSEQPQTSSSQPANTPGEALGPNTDTPLDSNHFDSYGRAESPTKYYRHDLSTTSTDFSTTNSAHPNGDTQNIGGRQKELGRKKAIKDAQRSKAKKAEQIKFSTRDQSHLTEPNRHEPPGGGERPLPNAGNKNAGSFDKPRRNGVQSPVSQRETPDFRIPAGKDRNPKTLGQKPSSKVTRSLKVDGNRPKLGTALQKRKTPFQRSKTVQRQLSPAQQAKALARRRAQKEMVKKAGQRTKQAAVKAGKLTMRFAQAVGRVALAAVKGVLAAGGGVILLIVLLCLILVAAIAASPFGIFFAGGGSQDGVPVSVAVAQVNYAYNETLEELQTAESYDDVVIEGTGADWVDVLAVFAVKVAGSNDTDATDVVTLDENRIDRLEAVFWDMNTIIHEVDEIDHPESSEGADDGYTERILHITITGKTAEEAAAEYNFTTQQLEMLQELLEEREMLADLIGSLMNITADAKDVLLNLPEDLSPEREAVIRAACSLVGKVNYFWGGKSLVLGWDSRWGRLTEVTAAGNSTTGTYRPYGLDCSGFVDWVFYNATGGEYIIGHGGGAMAQHGYCTSISWAEAQIGDLVFYPEDTHVGIVCGWDESGNILIVHCAFSANNVVITGQEGFTTIGRPVFYGGA